MASTGSHASRHTQPNNDSRIPTLCKVVGMLLIVLVFALTLPVTAPRIVGYDVYEVLSGSMEPSIPVGSVVYVKPTEPLDVQNDDVIAFMNDENEIVMHRVVENVTITGEFLTKGDANQEYDPDLVPYDALLGVVAMHVPFMGKAMALYVNNVGKVYLMLTLACGVMLVVLGDRLRRRKPDRTADGGLASASASRYRSDAVRHILMAILAAVFICSAGTLAYILHGYSKVEKLYGEASELYTTDPEGEADDGPKRVDFAALCAENPDVVGWLYCPDTPIDYPVLHGDNNDEYLHRDYQGNYDFAGSIFLEASNSPDFSDPKTIIYGHHLLTDQMFTTLDRWQDQTFYEEHPVMWLLTPTQDYQVVLVSGHYTSAYSDMYTLISDPSQQLANYINAVTAESNFTPLDAVTPSTENRWVMLSTCAYIFDDARYVLHGMLVPLQSAGGEPLS